MFATRRVYRGEYVCWSINQSWVVLYLLVFLEESSYKMSTYIEFTKYSRVLILALPASIRTLEYLEFTWLAHAAAVNWK